MENKSPDKIKYNKVQDEFIQFLKDTVKDPSLIDNKVHVKSMLTQICNYSIERHRENNRTAQEILDAIRQRNNEPSAIFPEDVDSAFQEGRDEGRRLGRQAIKAVAALFDSNDWYNDFEGGNHG